MNYETGMAKSMMLDYLQLIGKPEIKKMKSDWGTIT